ncbi:glycosyl hydrolase family 2 [Arcicella aurantiaca]|uniref:Glycosyl hydrolase family 2 n=1 Tax=Arcicella aurantiaca TaxID=591202 RepID=A0A316E387_9BACT|nr:glycosyl hydrolase [Arcicella aurantiaca]PWK23829.1 glycosyl hydrolase family 2 [Arcicella aurantiaca]
MKKTKKSILALCVLSSLSGYAQDKNQFLTPPNSAKPRVWWHWMNGNISKDGIQKDLDWMQRVGIGGFQNFDANLFTPVVVPKKLVFMQPDWKDAFKFTTELADKKGLEMAIAGSPGWSVTGGPWVKPEDGMKKYVFTEALVEGGKKQTIQLPKLPDVIGKYGAIETHAGGVMGGFVGEKPHFSADALVIAYKLPSNEKHIMDLQPKMTKSGGDFDTKTMLDHDANKTYLLPPMEVGQDMWIQYEFDAPQTFKAFGLGMGEAGELAEFNGGPTNRSLKVSDDGVNFRTVAKVSNTTLPFITTQIPTTTAKYWRICFETLKGELNPIMAMMGMTDAPKPAGTNISEFVLFNTSRIDQAEDKAGFSAWKEDGKLAGAKDVEAIPTADIVNLTGKMNADGSLEWDVPEGNWMVVRFGYSLTGRQNHPASPEATGLEVDKLDKEAVRRYINTYLDMYKDATGGLMGEKGLQYMVLDSYEAGHMNWTKGFPQEFKKRRGYDIISWIPALTGRVVNNLEATEKFLWDFRKTIGEMIAENHYDVIGEELHKRGMKRYTESHENGRIYLADGMDVKRNADIPMSAMWTPGSLAGGNEEEVRSEGDIREAASVANIYGQNIVAAESMTSIQNAFSWNPEKLKRTADMEMASGLNRFVIHTSVHQPLDKGPGFSLGPFGQYFTRLETWAEAGGKAWMGYLGRSSYMLQQGKNVADVLYYYGENSNVTLICQNKLPNIPAGSEFDFVNSSALLDVIQAKDGKLVAKSGNTYQVLMLDESAKLMTLPVLKKIKSLVDAGIKVVGAKPEKSPSLSDNDAEFQKLANEIWAKSNVTSLQTLQATSLQPDVIISNAKNKILFRHRQTANQEIYWLDNRSENTTNAEVSFRVSGKIPQLWNPETGKTEAVSYQVKNGRTIVPLKFESWEAYFIVFANAGNVAASFTNPTKTEKTLAQIATPWKVGFNDKNVTFDKLSSWSESSDNDIKYFSGTATYDNTFKVASLDKSAKYVIDLGEVKNIAEVIVNGKNVGTAWKKPFKLDISEAVKAGENTIQVKVTNLWVNRLIGDAQPNVTTKTTFTTMPFYRGQEPLLPSGLMSDVKITILK